MNSSPEISSLTLQTTTIYPLKNSLPDKFDASFTSLQSGLPENSLQKANRYTEV